MDEKQKPVEIDLSTNPNAKLCPKFDEKGIALYELASPEKMGFIVVDNCAQEHIQ